MADLIPAPDLDIRDERQLAGEAIGRVTGTLTVDYVNFQIGALQALAALMQSGAITGAPICPELTNANPSAPHTVALEAHAWLLAFIARRINQLPKRDQIEFARLFQIQLRTAGPAATTLQFAVAPPPSLAVTIAAGTQVATQDGTVVFETTADLTIPYGQGSGSVSAIRTIGGATLLAPNTLTQILNPVAWVQSATNPQAIDSGTDDESIDAALERARQFQQRGLRLVTTTDLENAVLQDVMNGAGIVKGFPFVTAGDFGGGQRPGNTTLVVMTSSGLPIDDATRSAINFVLSQIVGNQFVYISDPLYVGFEVEATIHLQSGAAQQATIAAVEAALTNYYAPSAANFGRAILRAQVITIIESTPGVDKIVSSSPSGAILDAPAADVTLQPWQLPQLDQITITVV